MTAHGITAGTLHVAVLDGSYFTPPKPTMLLDAAVRELGRCRMVSVQEISVPELGPGFTGARARDELSAEALAAVEHIERADVVLAGSTCLQGSYTGLFKHFLDFEDAGALVGTPVLLVAGVELQWNG
ncbi:NAD(P)H-dependent oxidoreductase [Pseudarthrobacter phenanthrenivorans]|uniref:NAD(P)H-dependent oxidoreductase n=1 Tax=Pseudarthrobacter phenanthrenivorans TaxID=361575 RepID=UPI0002F3C392|nr:NAD(P)H-dependent oxidoreductase [Pseudarthrobacter phenanthrenivorans]